MHSSPTPSPTSKASALPESSPSPTTIPDAPARPTVSPFALGASRADHDAQDVRRPSIQFLPPQASLPTGSPKAGKGRKPRRMSSPPPPPNFQPRVSFDTFDKPADFIEENSFTLIKKHKDYEYTKRSRTFLCGLDSNEYSEYALEWLIDELVDDGDEIVCLRVVERDASIAGDSSVDRGRYREEARQLMEQIESKNQENKAINLVLEFSVGKVNKVIGEMINLYEPAILIVGTKGRSLGGFQGLLPGSVSKYCLQHSPVPVIVVRPNSKRTKNKKKRMNDPSRQGYRDILDRAGSQGHILDKSHRNSLVEEAPPATDAEAAAVAAAIGYKPLQDAIVPPGIDTNVGPTPMSPDSVASGNAGGSSPEDLRSPGVVMKSPELRDVDSPPPSDISSDTESSIEERVGSNFVVESPESMNKEGQSTAVDHTTASLDRLILTENINPSSSSQSDSQSSKAEEKQ